MQEGRKTDQSGQSRISGRSRAYDNGFTLLELLISMTLLVIIIVLMMGAMRMGARSVAAGEKKMSDQERFRSVISVIDAQIQSQVPLTYNEDGNKKFYFRGEPKILRFATNYSIWGAQRGYLVVEYKVTTDNAGRDNMTATESTPGIEGHRDVRLIEATSVSFEYFRKEPSDEQGKWVESLTDANIIPEMIRVRLTQGSKKVALLFPVRVGAEMLSMQGGTPSVSNIPKSSSGGVK